jgi:hypothetical protein
VGSISEAEVDQLIREALLAGGAKWQTLLGITAGILDEHRLEGRLQYLRSTGQVRILNGLWQLTGESHAPPAEPDHRRIPPTCFLAHQETSEMARGVSGPARRNGGIAPPAVDPAIESETPPATSSEDTPMAKAKSKACRRCEQTKAAEEFSTDVRTSDGLAKVFKDCRGKGPAEPSARPLRTRAPSTSSASVARRLQSRSPTSTRRSSPSRR